MPTLENNALLKKKKKKFGSQKHHTIGDTLSAQQLLLVTDLKSFGTDLLFLQDTTKLPAGREQQD